MKQCKCEWYVCHYDTDKVTENAETLEKLNNFVHQ